MGEWTSIEEFQLIADVESNNRFNLIKWADRSALEEIEDMKVKIGDLERASRNLEKDNESFNSELEVLTIENRTCEAAVYGFKKEVQGFEKEVQDLKMEVKGLKNMVACVVVIVLFFKFVM
ncbi:hypothetical protein Bca101_056774 [Brassica carinata]